MRIEKSIKKIKKILVDNKWTVIVSIIVLFVRIKNSTAFIFPIFDNFVIAKILLEKPAENGAWAEIFNFIDTLGMSFLASLVFLFTSVTLPNLKKNRVIRSDLEDRVAMVLERTKNITVGCLGVYSQNPKVPRKPFSEYGDEEINWIVNNVSFDKLICLKGKNYITGYQFMYEQAVEIKESIDYIRFNYREYLRSDEEKALKELKESDYVKRSEKRYVDCLQSGQINIPKETLEEIKRNAPKKIDGAAEITLSVCTVEKEEIEQGVELYNKLKKVFAI